MKFTDLQLTSGGKKENRRALDFYPTPSECTVALCEFLVERGFLTGRDKVWEPAAGNGAMSKVLEQYAGTVFSTDIQDIEPWGGSGFVVGELDYLATIGSADWVITNPPFNRSAEFIKKAIKDAPNVAMLLKSQYWHAKSRLPLFIENPPAYVLPLTWRPDFMAGERGGSPTMEVAWTVWVKGDTVTKYLPLGKPSAT